MSNWWIKIMYYLSLHFPNHLWSWIYPHFWKFTSLNCLFMFFTIFSIKLIFLQLIFRHFMYIRSYIMFSVVKLVFLLIHYLSFDFVYGIFLPCKIFVSSYIFIFKCFLLGKKYVFMVKVWMIQKGVKWKVKVILFSDFLG